MICWLLPTATPFKSYRQLPEHSVMPTTARNPVHNNHKRSNFSLSSLADPPVVTFLNRHREFKNLKSIKVVVVVFGNGYGTKA
jgi:hypothetical protein